MTLCPIALVVGCKKCPVFPVCPLKGIIGNYRKEADPSPETERVDGENKPDTTDSR